MGLKFYSDKKLQRKRKTYKRKNSKNLRSNRAFSREVLTPENFSFLKEIGFKIRKEWIPSFG